MPPIHGLLVIIVSCLAYTGQAVNEIRANLFAGDKFIALNEGDVLGVPAGFKARIVEDVSFGFFSTHLNFSPDDSECFRDGVRAMAVTDYCVNDPHEPDDFTKRIYYRHVSDIFPIGRRSTADLPNIPATKKREYVRRFDRGGAELLDDAWLEWDVRDAIILQEMITEANERMMNEELNETVLCELQLQVERAKWIALTHGEYLFPDFVNARFNMSLEGTAKGRLTYCKIDGLDLKMSFIVHATVLQSNVTAVYDGIVMGRWESRINQGQSMYYQKRRNFIMRNESTKEYLNDCIPDIADRVFFCKKLSWGPSTSQTYFNVTGYPRMLWRMDLEDGGWLQMLKFTMTYTNDGGVETEIPLTTMFIKIRCFKGESSKFGDDVAHCRNKQMLPLHGVIIGLLSSLVSAGIARGELSLFEGEDKFTTLQEGDVVRMDAGFRASLVDHVHWAVVPFNLRFSPEDSDCFRSAVVKMVLNEFCPIPYNEIDRAEKAAHDEYTTRLRSAADLPNLPAAWKRKPLRNLEWIGEQKADGAVFEWDVKDAVILQDVIRNASEQLTKEDLNGSMNCDRQIEIERAKWTSLLYGEYLLPEFAKARFNMSVTGTTKASLWSCIRDERNVTVKLTIRWMVRQSDETEAVYDELVMGGWDPVTNQGRSMTHMARRNFILRNDSTKAYLEECVPDIMDGVFFCKEAWGPSTVQRYLTITGDPRMMWRLDVEDGMVVATTAKTMSYTNQEGFVSEIPLTTMFIKIRCSKGESFAFGKDVAYCRNKKIEIGGNGPIGQLRELIRSMQNNVNGVFKTIGSWLSEKFSN